MRKRLNLRFALYLLGGLAVLGPVTHLLHAYQVQRTAGAMLDRAGRVEGEGRLDRAADYLGRYLALRPEDTEALARYGTLLADERLAKSYQAKLRAKLTLDKVLYREPERHDIRRRVARLALDLGLYGNAREDIERLPGFQTDGELQHLLGQCFEALGDYPAARTCYTRATELAPQDIEAYAHLANLLRRHTKDVLGLQKPAEVLQKADRVVDEMVRANERSYQAYLYRASYRRAYGPAEDEAARAKTLQAVAADVARARELAPEAVDVLLAAAEVAVSQGDARQAREVLQRGCQLHPKEWRLYRAAAQVEANLGQTDAALECLRRGLREDPRQLDLLWDLADQLTRAGRREQAAEAIDRLVKEDFPAADVDCLRARLLMLEERWRDAIDRLEGAYAALAGRGNQPGDALAAALAQQAGVLLGECYRQIGDTERAYAAYSRVVALNDRSVPGRLGLAATRESEGRLQEALDQYLRVVRLAPTPASWIDVARVALRRNLERDPAQRDWREVDRALALAERQTPPPAVALLRAEYWAAQQQPDEARKTLLTKYGDPKTRPASIWAGLAALEQWQGRPEAVLALLDEAQRQCGDQVDLRLERARYWLRRGPDQARTALPPLAEGLDHFTAADRRRLLQGLADADEQAGLRAEATRLWQRLAQEQPNDLRSRLALFDLAVLAGDDAAMQRWQEAVRGIEGDDGVQWRYARAVTLLARAQRGDKGGLPEARGLLAAVHARRPDWPRVPLCEARLNELDGQPGAALPLYLRALQMGERDPSCIRRAAELLSQRGRYAEANQLFSRLPGATLLPHETQRVAAEAALYSRDGERALSLARAAVAADSKDFRDQLWLGRVYWAAGQPDRAEPALLRARELAPAAPETWVALVQFLAGTGRKDQARAEAEAARRRLTDKSAALAVALCQELAGQTDLARELYEAALKSAGDDTATLCAVAGFDLRTNRLPEARDLLLRLTRCPDAEAAAWARRTRAILLAVEGSPAKTKEALDLLGGSDNTFPSTATADEAAKFQRTRAQVLALQNSRQSRRAAAQLLEDLIDRRADTPADHFLAAQLHEAVGDWPKARQRYLGLLTLPGGDGPAALAAARSLLRHGEPDGAAQALRGLERQAPQSPAAKEIRARLLHLQGRTREALALLQECGRGDGGDPRGVAGVLEELGEYPAAEEAYRALAARARRPEDRLALAEFLTRRKRFADALEVCDRCWADCPPLAVAQVCLFALSAMPADPAPLGRVAARLEAALAAAPDQPNLLAALATVRNFQGRFGDAVALYRRVLRNDPRHGTALNNLAWLLALQGGHGDEALALTNRAAEVVGNDPGLLDTQAVAYLSLGRRDAADKAVEVLEAAAAEAPSATTYFHLAEAHALAGRPKEAGQAWKRAQALGLDPNQLHPLERPAYDRLAHGLN